MGHVVLPPHSGGFPSVFGRSALVGHAAPTPLWRSPFRFAVSFVQKLLG